MDLSASVQPLKQPETVPRLSVVVPCYNEALTLRELYSRVSAVCLDAVGSSYEVVLVNDGSADATWSIMSALADEDSHLVAVNLARNYGHQLALSAGLKICRGNRILILDADLQDPPELLPRMMRQMDAGADVVYGKRSSREGETAFKLLTSKIFYRIFRSLVDIEIPVDAGDFRLMSRRCLDVLNSMPEQHRFVRGMVSWVGFRQEAIEYVRAPRFAGETHYPMSKMVRLAIDGITSFSVKPLRIASWLGVSAGVCSFALMIYVFAAWVTGRAIDGWTSLMTVVLLIGSCQLLVVGLLGEYLGRLYLESKRRPLFVIESVMRKASTGSTSPDIVRDRVPTADARQLLA